MNNFATISGALAAFIRSGDGLNVALNQVIPLARNPAHREVLETALSHIENGARSGPVFLESVIVPTAFSRLFDLGERTNNLSSTLILSRDVLGKQHDQLMRRLTSMLTPVLTLMVGALIATLVFVLLSAVLEVSQVEI